MLRLSLYEWSWVQHSGTSVRDNHPEFGKSMGNRSRVWISRNKKTNSQTGGSFLKYLFIFKKRNIEEANNIRYIILYCVRIKLVMNNSGRNYKIHV